MQFRVFIALAAALTATTDFSSAFANAHPLPRHEHQAAFRPYNRITLVDMESHYTYDSDAQGMPELSDIIAQEKGATIAMDAILQYEPLVRAISGASADFTDGLTLLLPTNKAFQSLDSVPDDLEPVMQRHFIPKAITPAMMEEGATVNSYRKSTLLRFFSSSGKVYVQAGTRKPTEVVGTGSQAGSGTYFLVNELFV
ncbi:hypothetical protein GQ54DRAFT_257416 [Martensiomyces pterosporus]|nr:hypothetical protein GQ54DRAFT_257416 [Martensiomyces pterosporus]